MYVTVESNLNYMCVCVCTCVLIFGQYCRVSLTNVTGSASTLIAFMVKAASKIFIIFNRFIFISSMFIIGAWFDLL